ncbi:DUF2958 domain-containing protein [Kordia sp. TARA_039_SRF]|nr:DUF2958 domain-containing protein [Kordia sp. TARA_039_SRF]
MGFSWTRIYLLRVPPCHESQQNLKLCIIFNFFSMQLLTKAIQDRFQKVGSQEHVDDPIIIAKFFNPCGSGTWYATEYNPEDKIFFGYVTGFAFDEWGTFSLVDMESVKLPFGLGIERDIYFEEKRFSEVIK